MTTLRWAVVGFGDFGSRHATVLADAGQDVIAIVDPDADRRARAADLVPSSAVVPHLADALALEPDAVVVATPEHGHVEPVVRSLEVAHVLVEKPIASDVAGAHAMAAARASGKLLFVGHLLRFDPRLIALRALVADGTVGDVVHVACRRIGLRAFAQVYQRAEPLILSGVHDADVIAWLTDDRPRAVTGHSVWRLGLDSPEFQVAMIELAGGAGAFVEAGWLLPPGAHATPHIALELIGTEATARITDDGPLTLVTDAETAVVPTGDAAAWHPMALLRTQCEHVLAHIADGTPTDVLSAEHATLALETMLFATESARRGERLVIE